jgi:hypothetical protein
MKATTLKFFLLMIVVVFSTSNCGKKGRNSQITLTYSPESPIVINADIEIGDDTCAKPWFLLNYTLKNSSDRGAMLQALHLETRAIVDGGDTIGTVDVVSEVDGFPYLAVVDPGETESHYVYVCGLPKADDLTFSVIMEAIGWFGGTDPTADNYRVEAVERLTKFVTFTAQ